MKDGTYAPERDPHPRAATLAQFSAQSLKHLLYVAPGDIRPDGILKNRSQRFLMLFAHVMVVSHIDTVRNEFNCLVSGNLVLWFTRFPDQGLVLIALY
jgi:hypothetical protein